MNDKGTTHRDPTRLRKPLLSILILATLSIGIFLIVYQSWANSLLERVEVQHRQSLIQIVSIARNAVEPILVKVRAGRLNRAEALRRIRALVRTMTYTDQYGNNYIFMSTYEGIMLVQPFEPSKELTNQWDLRDIHGLYIIRELVKAARAHPEGSFVRYYYHLPGVHGEQEKLAYVVGLPELQCYIGTGMYIQGSFREQLEILKKVQYGAIGLLIAVLIPISAAIAVMLNRNRLLLVEDMTRQKAEIGLQKSEEKYRSFFENAMEGIYQTAEDGHIISVNPAFARIAGFDSPQEMIASGIGIDRYYADYSERERLLQAIQEKGSIEGYITRMQRKDGSIAWISINARVVKDEQGTVLYYEGTVEDINTRKQAEEEVQRLAAIVQHSRELVSLADMDGRMIYLNETGSRTLGIDLEDIEKISILQVIPDHLQELVKNVVLPTLMAGGSWEGDLQYINLKTGALTDVHALTFTIDDPQAGAHKYLANVSLDISRHKQAEEKFAHIFMMAPDGISITRMTDGLIIDTNLGFEAITGWKRSEVLGRTSLEVNFWADPADRVFLVEELKSGRDVLQCEFRFIRKDGTVRNGIYSARTIQIAEEACLIFVMQDITERKETDRRLRENEERLRVITSNIPGVVYQFYAKGSGEFGTSYTSDGIREVFGLSVEAEAMYPAFLAHVHEEDRERFLSSIRTAVENHSPWSFEGRFCKPSGEIIWFQGLSTPTPHENGLVFDGILLDVTTRKQAEALSRQAEDKFSKIFMTAPDCIAITRMADGLIADVSMGFEEITGWNRSEAIGRTSLEINFWFDLSDRARMVEDLKAGRDILQREFQFRRQDGTVRQGIYSARPVLITGVPHLIFVMQDITQRKETERILRENEERLRGIITNMPGVVFQFYVKKNGEYGISYASDSSYEVLKIFKDGVAHYEDILSHLHVEDRERFINSVQTAVQNRSPWNFEGRFIRPSGEMIWIQGLSTPRLSEEGLIFDGILLNITERKLAEEQSLQAEEKFAKVFMTTPDCIVITRVEDGRILDVNQGFEDITGWRHHEVLGRTSLDINVWGDPAERGRMVEDLKAGRDILQRESLFRRKDGTLRNVIYSARSIQIAGEACLIFVLQDMTDRKGLEDDRRKLEQQLYQSQKMDAIGQLASGVAHDFNNILTGIQGNASLMMLDYDSEHPLYQRLSQIEEQVRRGANLTRQLLGFARGGKYEVKTVAINDLIRKIAQFFLETRREIEADYRLQEDVYPVEVDAGQIEQVLLNLFINAGHAMPGGGSLHIQTANATLTDAEVTAFGTPPGDYVKITISDKGIGMDHETLTRIFEPFFTTRPQQGGTGLGLASAYGIIRNHGGAIHASSEPGKGSTFTLYLPSSLHKIEEDRVPDKDLQRGSETILLVDDEPMILEIASNLLKKLGYTVYQAANGHAAIQTYRAQHDRIDLVLLDMIMPGMSGSQTLQGLRDINPAVKVILSSGYSLQGEVQKLMETGCKGFIQKPYLLADLSAIVHRVLQPAKETLEDPF